MTRKDDTLPKRFTGSLTEGPYIGEVSPEEVLGKMLDYYYEFRGWIKKRCPLKGKALGIRSGICAKELEGFGIPRATCKQ